MQIGDPFEESKLLGVLPGDAGGRTAGLAAGPRRRRADSSVEEMAAGGGVGIRHRRSEGPAALRKPTWSRSRSWSPSPRSECWPWSSRRKLDRGGGLRALARRARRDRRGDHRASADPRRRRRGRHAAGHVLVDGCPLYDLEPAEPRSWIYGNRATLEAEAGAATPCSPCSPRPRPPSAGRSSSTTRSSARAPCAGPSRPTPRSCSCPSPGARSRSRSTATAAASPATLRRRFVEAVLECAANLACTGAEPLGLTNCLNFGNPEKPGVAWQLTRAVEASPTPARRSESPWSAATSRSTTRPPRARSTRPRSSAWSASCPTPRAVPGIALRDGDAIGLVGPFSRAPSRARSWRNNGRARQGPPRARRRRSRRCPGGRAAQRFARARSQRPTTSATAASPALAEMAIAGGTGARTDLAPLDRRREHTEEALFGEGPGGFVVRGERGPSNRSAPRSSAGRADLGSRSAPASSRSRSMSTTPRRPGARSASCSARRRRHTPEPAFAGRSGDS